MSIKYYGISRSLKDRFELSRLKDIPKEHEAFKCFVCDQLKRERAVCCQKCGQDHICRKCFWETSRICNYCHWRQTGQFLGPGVIVAKSG